MMKTLAKTFALTALLASCAETIEDDIAVDSIESEVTASAGTTYQIVHRGGRCLDVPGFARSSGVALQGHPCKTSYYLGNQQFTLEQVTGGYRLRAHDSQLCLDLPSSNTADGTIVQQSLCHAGQNQIWSMRDEAMGYVRLTTALDANKCMYLDAANALRLARCTNLSETARSFAFGATRTHASFRQAGLCLDLAGHTTASGASPQLSGCKTTDTLNQEWALEPVASGTFRLRSKHSQKCLDLRGGALTDGTVAEQQACTTANRQKWTLLPQTASTYKLQNVASGKCADFYGGALRTWTCSTSYPSQLFEVQAGLSGNTVAMPAGASPATTQQAPSSLWGVDSALVPPVVSGEIVHNSIIVRWSVSDPRIVDQRVLITEELPNVPNVAYTVMSPLLPRTQRAFWVNDIGGRALIPGARYTVRVLTLSNSGASAFVPASSATANLPTPTISVFNPQTNQTIQPTVVDTIAVFDNNGNGIVDGAPAGDGSYPRRPIATGPTTTSVANGNRYMSDGTVRANLIVGYTMLEGTRSTFVAVHLFVHPTTGAAHVTGAFYGDMAAFAGANVWGGPTGVGSLDVLPGDGAITPNIVDGELTVQVMANDGTFRQVGFSYLLAPLPR